MTDHRQDRASQTSGRAPAAFTCQGCGATFPSRQELQLHNAETHGGGSTGGNVDEPPSGGPSGR